MNIAYVIHAYKLSEQFGKLIEALNDENVFFFVHIDSKSQIENFQYEVETRAMKNVYFSRRERSKWGSFSCVRGVLNALEVAIKFEPQIDYFYFLSGQDYPIRSKLYIKYFTKKNRDKNFILHFKLPYKYWKGGGLHRITRNHFYISKNRIVRRLVNIVNFFLPRRKLPLNLSAYGGDFYMGLNRSAIKHILNTRYMYPEIDKFFENTYIPEELYFPTILLNDQLAQIDLDIQNQTPTYSNWSWKNGSYPAILDSSDILNLKNYEYLFARKIDISLNPQIITMIEEFRKDFINSKSI